MSEAPVYAVCWASVLADLCGGRLSTYAVAERIGVPRSTLRGWLDGSQPGHAEGERVIAVWLQVTGKSRELLPMTRRTLSAARSR